MATKVKPCRIQATGTPQAWYVPKYVDEDTFQWWAGWAWSWDVSWPASSTDWDLAIFDWATGKLIKDSWVSLADYQEKLTAWTNIQIQNNVISATAWSDIVYATQAEYNALLPWAASDWKHYFIYSTSGGWWQPWVNTLAYYPLTSTTTVNDQAWNYDLTNLWSVTFGINNWVDCWLFDSTTNSKLTNSSLSFSAYPTQTVSVWMYITWTDTSNYQTIYAIWSVARTWKLWSWYHYGSASDSWLALSSFYGGYEVVKNTVTIINWWHLLTNVTNGSSSVQYLDGQLYQNLTNSLSATQTGLVVWWWDSTTIERLGWCLSNLIIEDVARTAQEVSDYYNQTKWDYWIS